MYDSSPKRRHMYGIFYTLPECNICIKDLHDKLWNNPSNHTTKNVVEYQVSKSLLASRPEASLPSNFASVHLCSFCSNPYAYHTVLSFKSPVPTSHYLRVTTLPRKDWSNERLRKMQHTAQFLKLAVQPTLRSFSDSNARRLKYD